MRQILLKRLLLAGSIPTVDQVGVGELCLNVADGKIYTKLSSGVIICLGSDITQLQSVIDQKASADHTHSVFTVPWQAPGAIGSETANTGTFTTLVANGPHHRMGSIANAFTSLDLEGAPNTFKQFRWLSNGAARWNLFVNGSSTEGTGNTGASLVLSYYGNFGEYLGDTFIANRQGQVAIQAATTFTKAVQMPSFSVASLPNPANPGALIYVSDDILGATIAFSDGANWLRVHDRMVIS